MVGYTCKSSEMERKLPLRTPQNNNGLHTEPFLGRASMLIFLYGPGEPGRYHALTQQSLASRALQTRAEALATSRRAKMLQHFAFADDGGGEFVAKLLT